MEEAERSPRPPLDDLEGDNVGVEDKEIALVPVAVADTLLVLVTEGVCVEEGNGVGSEVLEDEMVTERLIEGVFELVSDAVGEGVPSGDAVGLALGTVVALDDAEAVGATEAELVELLVGK